MLTPRGAVENDVHTLYGCYCRRLCWRPNAPLYVRLFCTLHQHMGRHPTDEWAHHIIKRGHCVESQADLYCRGHACFVCLARICMFGKPFMGPGWYAVAAVEHMPGR
jgi:hypothetical protein